MPDPCSRQKVVRDADGFLLSVTEQALSVLTGLKGLREFWILEQPVFQRALPCPIPWNLCQ